MGIDSLCILESLADCMPALELVADRRDQRRFLLLVWCMFEDLARQHHRLICRVLPLRQYFAMSIVHAVLLLSNLISTQTKQLFLAERLQSLR